MIQSRLIDRSIYSLEERERLSANIFPQGEENRPHVLLATCNRTELYWGDGDVPRNLAEHLFRVAAGLESALTGERAIQGQIRRAYTAALEQQKLPASLNRLFQTAIHVGKRVRTETRIAEGAVSHSQATADMMRRSGIDLRQHTTAIIGVNKLTEDILKFLKSRGAESIYVSNRNAEKAEALARQYGGSIVPFDRKRELAARAKVIICATAAPHTILHVSDFEGAPWRERTLFDLAFPRDIDPEVARLPGITLYNLEDIEAFARHNLSLRHNEIGKAEEIIKEEICKLEKWQQMKHALA